MKAACKPGWTLLVLLAACGQDQPPGRPASKPDLGSHQQHSQLCQADLECVTGICVAGVCQEGRDDVGPRPDFGFRDLGTPDSGEADLGVTAPDQGLIDMGSPDAGFPDVGFPDAEPPEMGQPDLGPPDLGRPDLGPPDMGVPDLGPPDLGVPDLGPADSGVQIIDISGYVLENLENQSSVQSYTIPNNTLLRSGQVVVVARNATQREFETHWGMTFPAGTIYLNAQASTRGAPIINGGETWRLTAPGGGVIDGPTIPGRSGQSYQRGARPASDTNSWLEAADSTATPGTASLGTGYGLVISEWSDASGTGNYVYEYVEISYAP